MDEFTEGVANYEPPVSINAELWEPNAGDYLVGRVVSVSEREFDWGLAKSAVIEQDETFKHYLVRLQRKVIADQWNELDPQVGSRVGIKFCGQPEGKSYFVYHLTVDPAAPEWDGPQNTGDDDIYGDDDDPLA